MPQAAVSHLGDDFGSAIVAVRRPVAVEIRSENLQPLLGRFKVGTDLFDKRPEARAMIHFDEMSNFVGGHVVEDERRSQDQAP